MLHILIHILPQEIDQLELMLTQFKCSSIYLEDTDKILFDVVLNNNLTDWDNSIFPKEYFANKFKNLELLTKTWADTKFEINENGTILGCVSHRRRAIDETQADALLTIDSDILFSTTLLFNIVNSVKLLKNPYYVLTPNITPMWDNTWDLLVHNEYIHEPAGDGFRTRDPYKYVGCLGEVTLETIPIIKFGGGLATVISTKLAKQIRIPESLGHYGLEDTYMMFCMGEMVKKGYDVRQFILRNEVVVEDHLFRFNPYKNYLKTIDRREEFKKIASANFNKEIINFSLGLS